MKASRTVSKLVSRRIELPVVLSAWGLSIATIVAATESPEAFFETIIRPTLANRCVACHGPEKQEGSVRLDSRAALLTIQKSGTLAPTLRGKTRAPESCRLETRLADTFDQWIELGLPWPEKATVAGADDRDALARRHWAFQPIREPEVPKSLAG
ncbi:MAG: hypothetical protein KDM63_15065, partial [Verrucomicrobiae bacterium]|nr:hypothetical protein [Verrucomicrobiae bacterium]